MLCGFIVYMEEGIIEGRGTGGKRKGAGLTRGRVDSHQLAACMGPVHNDNDHTSLDLYLVPVTAGHSHLMTIQNGKQD